MKILIKFILAVLVAAGVGAVSAYMMIEKKSAASAVRNGSWAINTNIGAQDTDPYVKAHVALHALLALNKSEAIYFVAAKDAAGEALRGGCTYKVSGQPIDARWWTITAYGADDFLIPGGEGHFAVSVNELGTGNFSFPIAPALSGDTTGLATGEAAHFSLLLRTYNPSPSLLNDPGSAALPVITKENCNG